jgi:3-oxoacyl-[acyl-carrier protein] reductase
MVFDLDGRTAFVTGAGRGVGRGIAEAFAARGAVVVVNDIDERRATEVVAAIEHRGGRASASVVDITDAEGVRRATAGVQHSVGTIDILVNNAGIPLGNFPLVDFKDSDPRDWRDVVELNLFGVLNVTRAVLGGMCERRWGRIVTISSEAGRLGVEGGVAVYGAAKGAANAFCRNLAMEVLPFGVTVNVLSLSLMEGNWLGVERTPNDDGPWTQRLGRPADVAAAAVYLCSDEAEWVTGQTLPVNGGYRTS